MPNEFLTPYQASKVLEGVIEALPPVRGTLLQSSFHPAAVMRNSKTVNLDEEFAIKNTTAMFVNPKADVTPITLGDFGHKEYYFAYSKEGWSDADDFDVLDQRQFGQPMGQVNIAANMVSRLVQKAAIAEQRFETLFEKTIAELALYGRYVAESEKHPRVRYDFGRNVTTSFAGWSNALVSSINLTTSAVNAPWDATEEVLPVVPTSGGITSGDKVWTRAKVTAGTSTPVKDVTKMIETAQRWGTSLQYLIMQDDAYDAFNFDIETNYKDAADNSISTILSTQRDILPQVQNIDGLTLRRVWTASNGQALPIYTYNAVYNARGTGAETRFVPDGWVLGIPAATNGLKVYGRIMHPRAGFQAMPRFINRWSTDKDAINEYEEHTSFLIAHRKINAVISWKVV